MTRLFVLTLVLVSLNAPVFAGGSCRTQCKSAYNGDGYNCTTYCD